MTATTAHTNGHTVDVEALYRERRDRLVGVARQNGGDEDAVQEAFTRLIEGGKDGVEPGAFVTQQARWRARDESTHLGRQTPTGEHIDRVEDPAPEGNGIPCMGDPAVARKVRKALASLAARDAEVVRLHLLDNVSVVNVAARLNVSATTVYTALNRSLEKLRTLGVTLDDEPEKPTRQMCFAPIPDLVAVLGKEHPGVWVSGATAKKTLARVFGSCSEKRAIEAQKVHNADLKAPPTARTGRVGDPAAVASVEELAATLGKKFPGVWVAAVDAEQVLRRVHGRCSMGRARQAQKLHNAALAKPSAARPATKPRKPPQPAPATPAVAVPEPTNVGATNVAEVWLMGAKPPISCLLVHADESTSTADLAAVSLAGAQREITGRLVGDGYKPDGPWVDIDPAAPESMRIFKIGGTA